MQILTQTFAQLPIGLAIFDRRRCLNMFNPALLDLTGLPVDLLAKRPTLTNFLDAMREIKMLPEPKDYGRWRRHMNEIERAATSGVYEEIWSLLSGQTYRVVARPHSNGALALMIEDVSTETLRSRRYRADIELSHAITAAMDEAIAVFSQDGQLIMTNPAYLRLWGDDPAAGLAEGKLQRLCAVWSMASRPGDLWQRLENYALKGQGRTPWRDVAMLNDGRGISCRFVPLPGGASMIGFQLLRSAVSYPERVIGAGGSIEGAD
jgi:PAS domain-containing protein